MDHMEKKRTTFLIIFLMLLLGALACGTATLQSPPKPVNVSPPSATLTNEIIVTESSPPTSTTESQLDASMLPGLRVFYIREGNLWVWTEAGSNTRLAGTGNMSTVQVSPDGKLLASIRGREVWTVRMDGTDARMVKTLDDEGATLWFAPNGSLLAVSTQDHIDVIDLSASSISTVVTYPAVPFNFHPQVIWMPDSSGFKTVIPAPVDNGQAELLFVFTNGTVASLAKFVMAPLSESLPFISPDGGYLIYVSNVDEGKKSLFLMDSSGATKPYGDPGEDIRTFGWLPDSKHFVYANFGMQKIYQGNIEGELEEIAITPVPVTRWVDANHYLMIDDGNLILSDMSGGRTQIDSNVQDFDFVP
jgi:Tol biopolymer transport system component